MVPVKINFKCFNVILIGKASILELLDSFDTAFRGLEEINRIDSSVTH